ncbi:hypothetical protein OB962_03625 [Aeromonas piscicola]|uniref:Uncharacterized protein n=1 Tax=Aeromonas piscicola TaxID=600645 RepID=A0ABT7Q822_9GAMM|nr:hypothetical protein [Aeromonas piscicola]MDM5130094.1 hypothetical protein [Aeromonas piscicola]
MDKLISIFTLSLLTLTFLFGDDIVGNFQSAKLAYSTSTVEIKNDITNAKNSSDVMLFRQVIISNVGKKPSIDISALISLDGDIYSYEVSSVDQYKIIENKNSSFYFSMPRLTKGASITIKFLMKDGHNDFKINATDNKEAIDFLSYEDVTQKLSTLQIASALLSFIMLFIVFYLFKHRPLVKQHQELSALYQISLEENSTINAEKHELELQVIELNKSYNKTSLVDELSAFITRRGAR